MIVKPNKNVCFVSEKAVEESRQGFKNGFPPYGSFSLAGLVWQAVICVGKSWERTVTKMANEVSLGNPVVVIILQRWIAGRASLTTALLME